MCLFKAAELMKAFASADLQSELNSSQDQKSLPPVRKHGCLGKCPNQWKLIYKRWFPEIGVPLNHPLWGFSTKNQPFWIPPIYGKPQMITHVFSPCHVRIAEGRSHMAVWTMCPPSTADPFSLMLRVRTHLRCRHPARPSTA